MAAPLLNIPLESVKDIADTSAGLVDVSKHLAVLASSIDNPQSRAQLEAEISRILDYADRLSSAARASFAS
jgi:hypothetical protein